MWANLSDAFPRFVLISSCLRSLRYLFNWTSSYILLEFYFQMNYTSWKLTHKRALQTQGILSLLTSLRCSSEPPSHCYIYFVQSLLPQELQKTPSNCNLWTIKDSNYKKLRQNQVYHLFAIKLIRIKPHFMQLNIPFKSFLL